MTNRNTASTPALLHAHGATLAAHCTGILDCLVMLCRELCLVGGEVSEAVWAHKEANRIASLG
jgi:hypothetical protein